MSRTSVDHYVNGQLINGYDYENQCWVLGGVIQNCGHPGGTCDCFGREFRGMNHKTVTDALKVA